MYEPTPGWLAMKLRACGHELSLTLLAAGYLYPDPRDANLMYTELADCTDPFHELRQLYLAAAQKYPWLLGAVQPLLAWVETPNWSVEQALRRAAGVLADVDLAFVWKEAAGDPLGAVHNEFCAMHARQRQAVEYCSVPNIARRYLPGAWCGEQVFAEGEVFIDTAAATCVRPYTHAIYARKAGVDPASMIWLLADFDALVLALGAVQLTQAGPGDNVHFAVAPFPADTRTAWPTYIEEEDHRRKWHTDIPETLVRLGAEMPPDQFWRGFPGLALWNNPTFTTVVAIAHGLKEAPQDVYEAAVAYVRDPDFMLRGLVAGMSEELAEDYEEAADAVSDLDLFAMSELPVMFEDDFAGPAMQFRARFDRGEFAAPRGSAC